MQIASQLPLGGAPKELARNAVLRGCDGDAFDFALPKSLAHLARFQDKLKAAIEQHLGRPVSVRVTVGEADGESAASVEAARESARRIEMSNAVHGDAFVKDLVTMFDGKVIESTIKANGGNS
ncbi:MAG: DNA polymerase III subunit gamma/tau C-terminal domain-containing protein [Burkholderiales bacterium]